MNNEQLAELDSMSGAGQQSSSLINLDEVQLNGKDGTFNIKYRTKDKVKEGDKEKFEKKELGDILKVVFLKKRRKLVQRGKKGTVLRQTSEHSSSNDVVTLFNYETGKNEVGVASELRDKYPEMRTNEVMYAMDLESGTVFRLILKGSSLHMQEEVKGITLFYDYLKEFTGDDRFYKYETRLEPKPVEGQLGTIYAINFERGRMVTEDEFKLIADKIKSFNASCVAYDLKNSKGGQISTPREVVELPTELPTVNLDEIDYGDEINVDDIPF